MAVTYTPIATATTSGSATSITFSSIPSTYTDLVIVFNGAAASGGPDMNVTFNGDTGTNYSRTYLLGDGSSAASGRSTNASAFQPAGVTTDNNITILHINNYKNTTNYKHVLSRSSLVSYYAVVNNGCWRSTAAITSVTLTLASSNYVNGSTATIYGILAA